MNKARVEAVSDGVLAIAIALLVLAIHALSLQSRNVLPKVRAFVDFAAGELARSGVET